MRIRARTEPEKFTLETMPNRPGWSLARFYADVEPYTEDENGETVHGYVYDEYQLELRDTGGLEKDIANSYGMYLREAKRLAEKRTPDQIEEDVKALEAEMALADETAIELYEATLLQDEVNAAQDEALIELYERMETQ